VLTAAAAAGACEEASSYRSHLHLVLSLFIPFLPSYPASNPQVKELFGSRKKPFDPVSVLPSDSAELLERAKQASGQVSVCSAGNPTCC
jgi:hypothetical protein